MKKNLTCICCPLGCTIEIEYDKENILKIQGNTCKRGEDYARSECINPVRTVTSTVMSKNGIPVPVKTDKPIPKEKIFECMDIINKIVINGSVSIGDIIKKDVFGSNIIATADYNLD